jgi:adenylate cyclase
MSEHPVDPSADWRSQPREWEEAHAGPGLDTPAAVAALEAPYQVVRTFAFVDLCGFTSFTAEHGPVGAHELLVQFRTLVRDVAARRGVRIAKWVGDGALLVAVTSGPVVATVVDIVARTRRSPVRVRAGAATGPALLLDGDDYVGRAVNLASRLCDAAEAGMVLTDTDSITALPEWIVAHQHRALRIKGIGKRDDLVRLRVAEGVPVPSASVGSAS